MKRCATKLISMVLSGVVFVGVLAVNFYRTKTGSCYHVESCSCLKHSKILISDAEIEEAALRACSRCCK